MSLLDGRDDPLADAPPDVAADVRASLHWTIDYRTAEESVDPGPLMDALADLARQEGAVLTLTDSCGDVVLDIAPDDQED